MSLIEKKSLERLNAIFTQAKINSAGNTDEQALQVQSLYPAWDDYAEGATITAGSRVNYNGSLYNVLQEHQKQSGWTPETANYIFSKVLIPDASIVPEWEQPDYTNGYSIGDKVTHNGKTWESLVNDNAWEPGVAGTESCWKEVAE